MRTAAAMTRLVCLSALLLLLSLIAVAHAQSSSTPICAQLEAEGIPGSPVPRGWTVEAWKDAVLESEPDPALRGTNLPTVCLPPPDQGEYYLSNPIPEQGIDRLGYTARDWGRWDGFDVTEDLLYTPTRFGIDGSGQVQRAAGQVSSGPVVFGIGDGSAIRETYMTTRLPSVPLSMSAPASAVNVPLTGQLYHRAFKANLANKFYPRGYSWFRGFGMNAQLDYIAEFQRMGKFDMMSTLINVSYAINENYNLYRKTKRASIRDRIVGELRNQGVDPATRPVDSLIDSEFDATRMDWLGSSMMPRNQATIDWLERIIVAYMGKMCLTVGTMVPDGSSSRIIDAFGLFKDMDGAGYNQQLWFFYAHDWAYLAGRWMKFLRSDVIRNIRRGLYASLAASRASYVYRLPYEDRLSNQWLLKVASITTTVYAVLRSEAVLKSRGHWLSSDGFSSTSWTEGKITNADMLAWSELYLEQFAVRHARYGMTESLSTYYGYFLEVLVSTMMLAPSQKCYELYERVYKIFSHDLYSNYMPQAAAMSGSSGRHYDITTGLHGKSDYWETPLYVALLFAPQCAITERKEKWDGSTQETIVNLCTAQAPTLGEMTVDPGDFSPWRMHHAAFHGAGLHYLPFDAIFNNTVAMPSRITRALTTNTRGQERFNFFSGAGGGGQAKGLSMGWGAEENYGTGTANLVAVRMGGKPIPGSSIAIVKAKYPTKVHAYLRLMVENADTPFHRTSTYAVVSHEQPQLARWLIAQHQGWMLTTSLVAGRSDRQGSAASPFNTDVLLPISVDSLWANGMRLPTTVGTVIAFPPNTIFTVRHDGQAVAIRILRMEVSETTSGIRRATQVSWLNAANYYPGNGKQEYSLTWQVDSESALAGSGRVTIHHKHRDDNNQRMWRVSTLWGSGTVANDAEMYALQRSLRHATVTESITDQGWDATDTPVFTSPRRAWDYTSPLGQTTWNTEVQIGPAGAGNGGINLRVQRTDVYQPQKNDAAYRHPTAPMNVPPFYLKPDFIRTAQGKDMFTDVYGDIKSDLWKGPAFHTSPVTEALAAPYLTSPLECIAGVDSPCFQWRLTSDWSQCSVACRGGVRTRSVRCSDATGAPNTFVDDSLCMSATRPPTLESCNTGPCPPGAPTLERVQALDGYVRVWWLPPTDNGGDWTPLKYVALTSPSDAATTAPTAASSPMLVGPLTNGRSYTLRLAAVNSAGTGTFTSPSVAFVPDVYGWKYSGWSACSQPCGTGGQQTRTVSCQGSSGNTVGDEICFSLVGAAPTDLRQSCNQIPCTWNVGSWGSCSKPCSSGVQVRSVTCTGGTATIANSYCPTPAPATQQSCNTQACSWLTSAWSTCSKVCAGGISTRTVQCSDSKGAVDLALSVCSGASIGTIPATQQTCNTQACLPNQWITKAWGGCSMPCGPHGVRTRVVECQTAEGLPLAASECPTATKPPTQEACNTAACIWRTTSEWTTCSKPCGSGTRTRTAVCAEPRNGAMVDPWHCTSNNIVSPATQEACNTQVCAWASGPFGICSVSCGIGTHTREVWCSDGTVQQTKIVDTYCASSPAKTSQEACNMGSCIVAPAAPTITSVAAADEQATVYFTPAPSDTNSKATDFMVEAIPIEPGQTIESTASATTSTAPVQSSFEVTVPEPGSVPSMGGMDIGGDGTAVSVDDGLESGSMPPVRSLTAWGRGSPLIILGLQNSVQYRFSVSAINRAGTSAPSTPSAPVRPFPAPSAPPKFLRVSLSEERVPGELAVSFEPPKTSEVVYSDVPKPVYVLTAEPILQDAPQTGSLVSGGANGTTVSSTLFESISVNGTESPLILRGLDPALQYRLSLTSVNPAGSSDPVQSISVYRASPDATEWEMVSHGDEGTASIPATTPSIGSPRQTKKSSTGLSGGIIALIVILPLACLLAAAGVVMWRRRQAKTDSLDIASGSYGRTSSAEASPEASRAVSRDVSRRGSRVIKRGLVPVGDGELESAPMAISPRGLEAAAAAAAAETGGHHAPSARLPVTVDDELVHDIYDSSNDAPQPQFHDNPLSPAARAPPRFAMASSSAQASPSPSPLASPSGVDDRQLPTYANTQATPFKLRTVPPPLPSSALHGVHMSPLGSPSSDPMASPSGPLSPPSRMPRMSPPAPLQTPNDGAHQSPSPSPSPEPNAPLMRRPH